MTLQTTSVLSDAPMDVSDAAARAGRRPARRSIPGPLLPVVVLLMLAIGRILIWLACRLSAPGAHRLALWVSRRVEPLTRSRRHSNFNAFFCAQDRSSERIARLDEDHLLYLARMRAEIARCFARTPEDLQRRVILEGEEYLRDALSRGRGALIVSGHTATWWFTAGLLAARGYRVTSIFAPIPFPRVERQLLELTSRYNVRIAFVGRDAYKAALRAVERNEILYLTFDVAVRLQRAQAFPFGNGWLQVDPGPAILAVRNSMPVLQAACIHQDDARTRVSFYSPGAAELTPQTSSAEELCGLWTQRLDNEVRLRPEQWWPWGYAELLTQPSMADRPTRPRSGIQRSTVKSHTVRA